MPVFDYDHIDDFATVREHTADNIALLCPNHHRDKTSGRISREAIRRAHAKPYNRRHSFTTPHRVYSSDQLSMHLGSNLFKVGGSRDLVALWINGTPFVAAHSEDGGFTFSAIVTDEEGKVILSVDHGEIVVATDVWDYRYEGKKLTVRRGQNDILFSGEISDSAFKVDRGSFVDRFETGIRIGPNGTLHWTMSGLEVGSFEDSLWEGDLVGFAVIRGSCYPTEKLPQGGACARVWDPSYEKMAEQLRQDMERGLPGPRPRGLEKFRPMNELKLF
jgi:hypothetical protein